MNTWANTVLTDNGRALMAKLTQGNSLNITKAVTGAGFVTPGLLTKQTAIADPKQTLTFRTVAYPEVGKCAVTASLKNDGLATGYTATQVGIYAMDPDNGEILLFISQATDAGSGTIVPSVEEMPGYSAEWTFTFQYGQADGVTVTVDPSNTVSREEMENYVRSIGKRTARLTVGTSTSGWTDKDCDYLCDGTADDVEINAAIAALPATGGEVVLLDGSYNLSSPIEQNKSDVTLRGNGRATKLVRAFNGGAMVDMTSGTGTVEGVYIDGKSGDYSDNRNVGIVTDLDAVVQGCTIYDCSGAGIRTDSPDAKIIGNTITECEVGIYDGGGSNLICNNVVQYNEAAGIHIYGDRSVVTGNISTHNNGYNLFLDDVSRCTVTGNNFVCDTDDEFAIGGEGEICLENIITDNQVGAGSVDIPIQFPPIPVTLSRSKWVGTEAPYTYTISGYDGKTVEVVEDVSMTMEQLEAIESAKIKSDPSSAENILYAFGEKPAIDVPVLLIVR